MKTTSKRKHLCFSFFLIPGVLATACILCGEISVLGTELKETKQHLCFVYLVYLLTSCLSDLSRFLLFFTEITLLYIVGLRHQPLGTAHIYTVATSPIPLLKGQWTELIKLFLWSLMTGERQWPEHGKGINYSAQQCSQHI